MGAALLAVICDPRNEAAGIIRARDWAIQEVSLEPLDDPGGDGDVGLEIAAA
jgi:hypothetical protein